MYNVLIDEKQLAVVLEEGLEPDNPQYKDWMIEFFTGIRDRITVEALCMIPVHCYSGTKKRNGCSIYKSFANIHCVNCMDNSTWLCVGHWRDHRLNHSRINHLESIDFDCKIVFGEAVKKSES
jgi:hypothetical protein